MSVYQSKLESEFGLVTVQGSGVSIQAPIAINAIKMPRNCKMQWLRPFSQGNHLFFSRFFRIGHFPTSELFAQCPPQGIIYMVYLMYGNLNLYHFNSQGYKSKLLLNPSEVATSVDVFPTALPGTCTESLCENGPMYYIILYKYNQNIVQVPLQAWGIHVVLIHA